MTPSETPIHLDSAAKAPASSPTVPDAVALDCAAVQPRMRADARRNRLKIVEAARTVFAETGAMAQMDDIAAAAGVGVGTVYRHFPTKDALMGELLVQKFTVIVAALREAEAAEGDPGERLFAALLRNADQLKDDMATQHALSGARRAEAWDAARPLVDEANRLAAILIEGGKATGTIRADMEVGDIGLMMCGVAATMSNPDLRPFWKRHMTLLTDSLRPPARTLPAE